MKLESKLKHALKLGTKEALEEVYEDIYNEYYKLIYFIVIQILQDAYLAEEAVNDVFLKAFNNIDKFQEDTSLKSWIVKIAKNHSINIYNKNKRENVVIDDDYIMNIPNQEQTDFKELIKEFRQYLTVEETNIVLFRIYYQMRLREIAEFYNSNTNDIYTIYQRALKILKQHYKKGDF